MATGNNPKLNIGPSKESLSELDKFLRLMKGIQSTVKSTEKDFSALQNILANNAKELASLKQDMRAFKTLSEGLKRNSIVSQGAGSYFEGVKFRSGRAAAGTARLGTQAGQELALQQETLRLAKQGLTYSQQRAAISRALNLDLDKQVDRVSRITSLEKARQLVSVAQIRLGHEAAKGDRGREASAQHLLDKARERVRLLEKEQRVAEKAAKEEERRARKLRELNYGDRQMERARTRAGWRARNNAFRSNGGADMFGIQGQIMANYMVMNQGRNALVGGTTFSADLDESMRNLQAITVVTDENLAELKEEILDVSEATKFFATDIADAAVTLGQAGFSTKEITDSIRAVSLLATATGTDLKKSVDLTTSILGVFRMESAQMAGVADTLTAAVNNSKLNIDKLALGLQYAGNTAAQSGVSFEELTASLGAMANAGIRSGSTLGTGMRQILIALQKPSGRFKESLDRLGLSLSDVDLRANGLYGVMKNLKEGGFTAGDAIRSFEVRAAAAFNALSGNLGEVVKLERAFLNTSAATKANETQMRALSNQGRRLQANMQALVATGIEPLVYATRDLMSGLADMMEYWRSFPQSLRNVATALVSVVAGLVAVRGAWLAVNIFKLVTGLGALGGALKAVATGAGLASLSFGPVALAAVGLATGIGIAAAAFGSYDRELSKMNDGVEKAQTYFDKMSGAMEETGSQIEMVDDRIKQLSDRTELLNSEQNLLSLEADKVREQFGEMGLQLGENVTGVEELIEALKLLRGELADDYVINVRESADAIQKLREANDKKIETIQGQMKKWAGHRVVRSQWERSGREDFLDTAEAASNPDNNLRQLQGYRSTLLNLREAYTTEGAVRGERRLMDEQIDYLDEMIELRERNLALAHQERDLRESAVMAESRRLNKDLVSQVDEFELGRDVRINRAADGAGTNVMDRYEAGRAEMDAMRQEGEALVAAIDAREDLNDKVRDELKRGVENTIATAQLALANLGESAVDIAKNANEAARINAEVEANRLKATQSRSESPAAVEALGKQRLINLDTQRQAEIDTLKAEVDFDTDSEVFKARLNQLEQDMADRRKTIMRETSAALARLKDQEIQQLKNTQDALEQELEKAVTGVERSEIREQLSGVAVALGEAQKERDALLIEGAQALATAQEQTDLATQQALAELSEDDQADRIAEAERDVEVAERALEAVKELARTAVTNKELAEAQIKKAKALADYAEAVNNLAQVNTEAGEGTSEANLEDAEFSLSSATSDADRVFESARKRIDRGSGGRGGGNPYKKKRDYIDELIDDLEAKLVVAENYLTAGQDVSVEYDNVMSTALDKVKEIQGQIDTLQKKMATGGLTVSEQQQLNTLIDQQARMTTFIREEEMRIARIKLEQSQYQEGLLLTTQAWARENLNMSQTIQDGLTGALSTAKNSLSEFFQTWSDGTKTGKDAFRDLASSVIKSIHSIFTEMLAVYLLQKALGWLGGAIGGDFGAALSDMASKLKEGGSVRKAAAGEYVQGNLNRDSQRYDLMPGEFVLRRSAVQAIGVDELKKMNAMGNRTVSTSQHHGAAQQTSPSSGQKQDINFYLVDERSQAPSVGPSDVIAIVTDDIARGGTTKKLIKTVQMGGL